MLERLRRHAPSRDRIAAHPGLRWAGARLAHPRLWHWSRRGVALGVFLGFMIPLIQMPFAAAAAVMLRVNVPAAAVATFVTKRPMAGE